MRCARLGLLVALSIIRVSVGVADEAARPTLWAVDPHVKVFRDAKPAETPGVVTMRAVRNEYEPGAIRGFLLHGIIAIAYRVFASSTHGRQGDHQR